jgi:LuxR family maltose regulon positive regulatory protein
MPQIMILGPRKYLARINKMSKQSSIAKITRPRMSEVMHRPRLFRKLDKGRASPITWVSGPAGSGKTTLVASWLDARKIPCLWYHLDEGDDDLATFFYYLSLAAKRAAPRHKTPLPLLSKEYLRGIPAFTRGFFENLCARLKTPFVIVLDNYHHVSSESPFHLLMHDALSVVPDGIAVVTISRGAPPPSLALLSTYNKMRTIGWDELKFDRSEIESLLRAGKIKRPSGQLLTRIESMTTGWAAGLVLLLERMRNSGLEPHDLDQVKSQEFFDYFASELFEKTDEETRHFLLTTAVLPRITAKVATALTGNRNAGTLLASLSRNHFFTEQRSMTDPVYQYHPLFRDFLQSRVRERFSAEDALKIQRHAAQLLEEAGQVEDAAALYRTSGSWEGFVRIILINAGSMMSQGRYRPLEEWLKSLPGDVLEKDPWLLYWMGVCRMPFMLLEGRQYFERSFTLFKKRHDTSGVYLAWSGVTESIIQELGDLRQLDPWIAILDELVAGYPFPSPQIEDQVTPRILIALTMRQSWHPQFETWKKKALTLLVGNADISLRMMAGWYLLTNNFWTGDFPGCAYVIDVIRRTIKTNKKMSPLAEVLGYMSEAWFSWLKGSFEHCFTNMSEGLSKSKESGVHIWDGLIIVTGVGASLSKGDLTRSEQLLEKISLGLDKARLLDKYYYCHLSSSRHFLMNDISRALAHEEQALALAGKMGFWYAEASSNFAMALLFRAKKERKKAKEQVVLCSRTGRRFKSALIVFKSLLVEAALSFDEENEKNGLKHLREAMALGKEKGYVYFAWWYPPLMTQHCIKALEAGIETEYVKFLIKKCNLTPEEPPLHIENWPWQVKIFTLGGFRLLLDDKPVSFTGKVQKKPLELLKALIALGGRDIREDHLTDVLWPDADGDSAGMAYRITLHRLRQLVGNAQAITVLEGRVSLNPRICWVDAWAFERMLENSDSGVQNSESNDDEKCSEIMPRLGKALNLYRGHFLSADDDKPWSVSARERLQRKFLRAVDSLGSCRIEAGQPKKAMECYEKGLEIDDLTEEFYQGLMACNLKLGRKAEAIKVYRRCKQVLAANLGVEPSPVSEEIVRSARR